MKQAFVLLATIVFMTAVSAQTISSPELSSLIRKLYGVATYERDNIKFCSPDFKKITDSTDRFYKMSDEYGLYLDYFLTVYGLDNLKILYQYKNDSTRYSEILYDSLARAPLFNKCLALTVSVYAKENGLYYKDYTPPSQPVISIDELMKVASKFFYATDITGDTAIQCYVCVGNNPYRMEDLRSNNEQGAFIEAFCFSAIMRNIDDDKYTYYDYYDKYGSELTAEMKDIEPAKRLVWVRNKLYNKMEKSADLKKMLEEQYQLHKDILPFTLSEY